MADHLNVVPIRPNDESRVVVLVVLRAKTWRTVVFCSRVKRGFVEVFYLSPILSLKGQMQMRGLLFDTADAQRRVAIAATKLDAERSFRNNRHAKRLKCFEKERFAHSVVAYPKYDVVKHEPPIVYLST